MSWEEKLKTCKPLADGVVIEWDYCTEVYESKGKVKLIRPETHNEMHYTGTVVAVGPMVKDVEIGDRVFFDRYCSPKKFEDIESGKRFAWLYESDCIAKVPARDNERWRAA